MSYILDALKKSEQERGAGKIPDVQTIHSASLSYRQEKRPWWPYALVVAVLLNLAAIVYFNLDKGTPDDSSLPAATRTAASPATVTTQVMSAVTTPPASPAAISAPVSAETHTATTPANKNMAGAKTPAAPGTASKPATATDTGSTPARMAAKETPQDAANTSSQAQQSRAPDSTASQQPQIIDFSDLPESIRADLPVLLISAHVYSSNPLQRSIVINSNFMEEGEYVLDGLVLYEITPQGAIFSYRGYLFHYPVVSGWQ